MDKLSLSLPAGYAPDTPVLVAFSGGADSTLLLHLLLERARQHGARLYAVHVHHGIRGAAADADLRFCRQVCQALHVPLFAVKVNVPALAKASGQSLEEAARHARYRHFARLMQKYNVPLLATAHHADDNLETVLFRICRGTGVQGLRGIPACGPLPDAPADASLCVFRPLLHLTKQEILGECRTREISFVTDATNACCDYARNRIRNRIIPELEQLFAHPQHAVARLCRAAAEDDNALDTVAAHLYRAHGQNGSLPISLLRSQPPAVAKRLIRRVYADFARTSGYGQVMPEAVHLEAVLQQICSGKPGSISLPGSLAAVVDRDVLRIAKDRTLPVAQPYLVPLTPGFTQIESANVAVWAQFPANPETITPIDTNVYNLYTELDLRFDTIREAVFLRPLRPGDTVLSGGMHKKIRKLYGQSGVPLSLRSTLPLLADGGGILAVPGICIRDGCRATAARDKITVRIYLKKSDN